MAKSKRVESDQEYEEAIRMAIPELVQALAEIIGKKLTAYIGDVKDVRAVDRWIQGTQPDKEEVENRLRQAYIVAKKISNRDHPRVVQAWLMGLNPLLDDRAPIRLLREGDMDTDVKAVLNAARVFAEGG